MNNEPKSFSYLDLVDFLPESLWTPAYYTTLASMEDIRELAKAELIDNKELDMAEKAELRRFLQRIGLPQQQERDGASLSDKEILQGLAEQYEQTALHPKFRSHAKYLLAEDQRPPSRETDMER